MVLVKLDIGVQKSEARPSSLILYSEWDKDFNTRPDILNLMEEKAQVL